MIIFLLILTAIMYISLIAALRLFLVVHADLKQNGEI